MKTTKLNAILKNTGLVIFAAFGLLIFSGIEANAQWGNRDRRNDRRDDRRDNGRWDDRRDDRRDNGRWDNRRDDRRDNGRWDNRRDDRWGNNNGNWGGNRMFRVAREFGYRDGVNKGIEEFNEGKRYNPENTRTYRNALNGYDRSFGDRDAYRRAYRQAFLQGFREGYRRSGRQNTRGGGWWGF